MCVVSCVLVWFPLLEAGCGGFAAKLCVCVSGLVWRSLGCGVCFWEVKESQGQVSITRGSV